MVARHGMPPPNLYCSREHAALTGPCQGGCTASYSPTGHIQSMPCSYHKASGHGRAGRKMHRNCCKSLPKPKVDSCNLISLVQSLTCQRYWQGNKNLGENTQVLHLRVDCTCSRIIFKDERQKGDTSVCPKGVQNKKQQNLCRKCSPCDTDK